MKPVILLSGEPGIGKSTVVQILKQCNFETRGSLNALTARMTAH